MTPGCTTRCRQALGSDCHCPCEGRGHGADSALQQLVIPLAAAVPVLGGAEPPSAPPELASSPLILPAKPSAGRTGEARKTLCDGCRRPWTEVGDPWADIEPGLLCFTCAEALWRAS